MLPRFLVLLCMLTTSVQANDQLTAKLRQRSLIIANGYQSTEKEANQPGTPAYFIGIPTNSLVTDMASLSAYPSGQIMGHAWSGYYWPNYVGGVAYRYHDPKAPKKWIRGWEYFQRKPSHRMPNDYLSPAEKYDVIMGVSPEEKGSLTQHQWNMGRNEYQTTGKVETWQGICHGWAAASIYLPYPEREVRLNSPRGMITFTQEDMKALGSLLYATAKFESVFAGFRCNRDDAERGEDGRVITSECFDMNPADWHLLVTHELGMRSRPFIIDYVNDTEVWNKPVVAYSMKYFNPLRQKYVSNNFRVSMKTAEQVDQFRRYRNPATAYVVGVKMKTTLVFGSNSEDNGEYDVRDITYKYLLELDRNYRIIGGEWITEKHPDFAWKPRFAGTPSTPGDMHVRGLTLNPWESRVNPQWRKGAMLNNITGTPLTPFVKQIYQMSSGRVVP